MCAVQVDTHLHPSVKYSYHWSNLYSSHSCLKTPVPKVIWIL